MGNGGMAISLRRGTTKAASGAQSISPSKMMTHRSHSSTNGIGGGGGHGTASDSYGSPPTAPSLEEQPQLALGPTLSADPEQLKRRIQSVVTAVESNQKNYEEVLQQANKATEVVRSMEVEIRCDAAGHGKNGDGKGCDRNGAEVRVGC